MTRRLTWMCLGLLLLVAMGPAGCVAQKHADDLRTVNRQLEAQILELRRELDERNAMIAALQGAPDQQAQMLSDLQNALAERDRLRLALENAEAALRDLRSVSGPLPVELDAALKELAAAYPDLMSYDPDLGMIQLRSDLTFALGSTQLSDQARQSLGRLGQVLRSPAARDFEVRIAGHTDNVPVKSAAGRQKFEDNWGLSAFRAISVMRALQEAGLPAQRMYIAGYGEFRPVVPNGQKGAAANRRVELYLKPMSPTPSISQPPSPAPTAGRTAPAAAPTSPAQEPVMFK